VHRLLYDGQVRMTDFTYQPNIAPKRPFRRGDVVELVDSQGFVCGTKKIVRIQATTVKTDCGRTYMKDGRWYSDRRPWPFPWIRLAQQHNPQP
jgi:hypothetical protein